MSLLLNKNTKVVFMGTPEFSVPALKALIQHCTVVAVYTQPDKPVGRGLKLQASVVKQVALEHDIPVFTPEKISTPEEIEKLKMFHADFFVVVAYGQILKPGVYELPKYSCINIHSSLLPRWRGAAPIHWALMSGDAKTGVTTMKIAQKLDAGDLYLSQETEISDEETISQLHDRLATMGADLILQTLEGILSNKLIPKKQDESLVTYASKITKEMGSLNLNEPVCDLVRKIRALNPWPGTQTQLMWQQQALKPIKIRKAKVACVAPQNKNNHNMGELFEEQGRLYLQCKTGCMEVLELQEEGKRNTLAADFVNGIKGKKNKEQ